MRTWCVVLAIVSALAVPRAWADDFCSTCQLQLGIGGTYHYWGYTHSLVVPVAFNFDSNHWELAAFRFTSGQNFFDTTFGAHVRFSNPYWGFSLTRRLELFPQPHFRFFVGLGASYKTEQDRLSASWWNFSEQIGFRVTPTKAVSIELVGRHFSNAGLKLPNHGQDFATIMVAVYPGLIGHH